MLKRSNRISGRSTVETIIKKGDEQKSRLFFIRSLPNKLEHNRFGLVISSKIEKSAVKRNKKRRQIYEIIRLLEKDNLIDISTPSDIVLLARKVVMSAEFEDLNKELKELLT